jgi:hypothetical protein
MPFNQRRTCTVRQVQNRRRLGHRQAPKCQLGRA